MKIIGAMTVAGFLLIYATIINAWALVKLWTWFMVPVFHLPALGIASAAGVCLVVSYLTHQIDNTEQKGEWWELMIKAFVYATFKPLFALAFGFVINHWM